MSAAGGAAPDPVHRVVEANGIRMRLVEQGAGPLVLLCHGFPESWYSWRHQLPALAAAGYRAAAPDMRGYGGTDRPAAVEQYTILHLVGDMVGLLDALGEARAVIVGHDWGAAVAWAAALMRPDRFGAVVGLSVPFGPRPPIPPTRLLRAAFAGQFMYMLYFQEPGAAEAELEQDVRGMLRRIFHTSSGEARRVHRPLPPTARLTDALLDCERPPAWLAERDLDVYAAEFARTGFTGALNWYRAMDLSWELTAPFQGARVAVPALFLGGDRDLALLRRQDALDLMAEAVPTLRGRHLLPGCGHWTQQERPAEVNRAILGFLAGLEPR